MSSATTSRTSLAGRRVLVTREHPGELGELLAASGAEVVHAPLIETIDPADGGAELAAHLVRLDTFDWLVVTSVPGAERVGAAARRHPLVRLAAVGAATASVLAEAAGRPVDVTPDRQLADALADALTERASVGERFLIAQADRAASTLEERLAAVGHAVTTAIAYRTRLVAPDPDVIASADALTLASGSAATSWAATVGVDTPPIVVAIGPSTAGIARQEGLKVTGVAADHSLDGLVNELARQFALLDERDST